jgi:hypothetical protein
MAMQSIPHDLRNVVVEESQVKQACDCDTAAYEGSYEGSARDAGNEFTRLSSWCSMTKQDVVVMAVLLVVVGTVAVAAMAARARALE